MANALAIEGSRLLGDMCCSFMGLCLTEMHPFGLMVPSRSVVTSLISRLRGVPARLRSTLLRSRGKLLKRRQRKWALVKVSGLAHRCCTLSA